MKVLHMQSESHTHALGLNGVFAGTVLQCFYLYLTINSSGVFKEKNTGIFTLRDRNGSLVKRH